MRKFALLGGLAATMIVFGASAAEAQRDSVFKSRKSSTIDQSQMSIDVSQFDPNVQIGEILRTTKMLAQQNQQLMQEMSAAQQKIDELQGRLKAISNSLNPGTGETIGSMVNKIKLKVGVPY